MAIARHFLRRTRGDAYGTVSGTINVDFTGGSPGDTKQVEVDHSATVIDGESTTVGRFVDNPMPVFDAVGGFTVMPVLDGTNGDQFRVWVTYIGLNEVIQGFGTEQDAGDDKIANLPWTRTGVLTDSAG